MKAGTIMTYTGAAIGFLDFVLQGGEFSRDTPLGWIGVTLFLAGMIFLIFNEDHT